MRWRTLSESKREMDHTHTYMFVMDRVTPLEAPLARCAAFSLRITPLRPEIDQRKRGICGSLEVYTSRELAPEDWKHSGRILDFDGKYSTCPAKWGVFCAPNQNLSLDITTSKRVLQVHDVHHHPWAGFANLGSL
jgi:hypothetical protein